MSVFTRKKDTGELNYGVGAYGGGRYGRDFERIRVTASGFSRVTYMSNIYGGGIYGTGIYSQDIWVRQVLA